MSDRKLTRDERLKSAGQLDVLFKEGRSFVVFPLRFVWMPADTRGSSPVRIAFSVSRKHWKRAVDRNLLKRRMREAYRTQKYILYPALLPDSTGICLACLYIADTELTFEQIKTAMIKGLKRLGREISAQSPRVS